jgi:hypothetical protein
MAKRTHPHAGATYRVLPLAEGEFGVEVTIPDTHPTMVRGFGSQQSADEWAHAHERRVLSSDGLQKRPKAFRRAPPQ